MKKYRLRPWVKVVIGLGAILLIMAMGMTDCPKCHHIICQCDSVHEEALKETPNIDKPDVEGMILQECDEQGIDGEIALAISKLETGHFKSDAYKKGHNVGGISIDEVPLIYESDEEGVKEFVTLLNEHYFSKGYDTVKKISQKYCPVNAKNWENTVNELREEAK